MISSKLRPFGTSIFAEMTALATSTGAINLAQGFPDFDGPPWMIEDAIAAMRTGRNQYARSQGVPELVDAVQKSYRERFGMTGEVLTFSGATEGIASTMLGLLDPGDEVVLFEPYYDSYPACVAMAGGVPRYVTLHAPDFHLDPDELRRAIGPRTKLLVLNTPHNPTGKVFSRTELEEIARVCVERNVAVLADEVYEHLTYDGAVHVPIATLPGMAERTLTLSSAGKTFSYTGWKVGWAIGPSSLAAAVQAAHQFVTFSTATPLQVSVGRAVARTTDDPSYLRELKAEYTQRRDFLLGVLREVGFEPVVPKGTYFVVAGFSQLSSLDDKAFVRELTVKHGVAAIPPSPFYTVHPDEGRKLVRFSFCKKMSTLEAAAERLRKLKR